MQQQEQDFTEKNVSIAVVTFEADYFARSYIEETGLKWPLLIDDTRVVYHGYHMLKASFWDVWGPRTWWVYGKELIHGNLPHKAHGDINQRGGDVLIDPSGQVRIHHVGPGPADRPSVNALLQALD